MQFFLEKNHNQNQAKFALLKWRRLYTFNKNVVFLCAHTILTIKNGILVFFLFLYKINKK